MIYPLETYAHHGEQAAIASLARDATAVASHLQWAVLAIKLEYEPDRILARHAYDSAYKRMSVRLAARARRVA